MGSIQQIQIAQITTPTTNPTIVTVPIINIPINHIIPTNILGDLINNRAACLANLATCNLVGECPIILRRIKQIKCGKRGTADIMALIFSITMSCAVCGSVSQRWVSCERIGIERNLRTPNKRNSKTQLIWKILKSISLLPSVRIPPSDR